MNAAAISFNFSKLCYLFNEPFVCRLLLAQFLFGVGIKTLRVLWLQVLPLLLSVFLEIIVRLEENIGMLFLRTLFSSEPSDFSRQLDVRQKF